MRRTIFLALFAVLLLVPTARAAGPLEIIRDCADDGVLQGDYTPTELRKAQSQLPTDIDEYSDCRDVLSRAVASSSGSTTGGGWESDAGTPASPDTSGSTSGDTGASGDTSSSTAQPAATPSATAAPAQPDAVVLAQAATTGAEPVVVGGHAVSPGESKLAAQVGRNGVPTTTVAVVALLLVAFLTAVALPTLRRRRDVAGPKT